MVDYYKRVIFMTSYPRIHFSDVCKHIKLEDCSFNSACYVVKLKDDREVARYGVEMTYYEEEKFNECEKALFNQFLTILQPEKTKGIYIFSYDTGWGKSTYYDSSKIDAPNGAMLTDEKSVLEEVFKNAVRYCAFPIFVNTDLNVAVIPTDHMDLFVATENDFDKQLIDGKFILENR